MNELDLQEVEIGLNLLISKYRKNEKPGDDNRLMAAIDAKDAIRRVILYEAIKGNISSIRPLISGLNGAGWEIVDGDGSVVQIFKDKEAA